MPIVVVCPGCGTKLNAPDTAAGKRVKCPKPNCGTVVSVPAPEPAFSLDDEQPPAKPKKAAVEAEDDTPRKANKPVRKAEADEDEDRFTKRQSEDDEEDTRPTRKKWRAEEDDEDDEDDRPTRRRRKPAARGVSPVVIGAIALGSLLMLGGVGYGIYALTKKDDDTASGSSGSGSGSGVSTTPEKPKGKTPEKWVEYTSTQDKFKMTMPPTVKKKRPPGKGNQYESADLGNWLMVMVYIIDVPPNTTPERRKIIEGNLLSEVQGQKGIKVVNRQKVLFQGKMVEEVTIDLPPPPKANDLQFKPRMVVRAIPGESRYYLVFVAALQDPDRLKDAPAIFDTFQILP